MLFAHLKRILKLDRLRLRGPHDLPLRLAQMIRRLHEHYRYLDQEVADIERDLRAQLREDENAARLLSIPGIGTITASLLASEIGNVAQFAGGRNFAASVGPIPRQYSTGDRSTLGEISKRGDSIYAICLCEEQEPLYACRPTHRQAWRVDPINADSTSLKRGRLCRRQQARADRLGGSDQTHRIRCLTPEA